MKYLFLIFLFSCIASRQRPEAFIIIDNQWHHVSYYEDTTQLTEIDLKILNIDSLFNY